MTALSALLPPHFHPLFSALLADRDDVQTHLVLSQGAPLSIKLEMDKSAADFEALADVTHDAANLAASISSGSFRTCGMVVIPCSMKTLAAIASGVTADLIARAADVCLRERRRLILVTRETPLNLIHIRNMETVTLADATVLPPVRTQTPIGHRYDQPGPIRRPTHSDGTSRLTLCPLNGVKPTAPLTLKDRQFRHSRTGFCAPERASPVRVSVKSA